MEPRVSVYIIAVGVYHHAERVFLRLDDIQGFALMIYNSFGIDDIPPSAGDIQRFALMICTPSA